MRLQHQFFHRQFHVELWERARFQKEYGIGSKIAERSYRYFKSQEPLKFRQTVKRKYSLKMRSNQNGYSGPPRPLVPKRDLEQCLEAGMRRQDIVAKFGLTDFLLDRNLKWWTLRDVFKQTRKLIPFREQIENRELFKSLDAVCPGIYQALASFHEAPVKALDLLYQAHLRLQYAAHQVQQMGTKAMRRCPEHPSRYSFLRNYGELAVANLLVSNKVVFRQQHYLGRYSFDFLLPDSRTLIEVDGECHRRGTMKAGREIADKQKDSLAKRKGFRLIRVSCSGKGIIDLEKLASNLAL